MKILITTDSYLPVINGVVASVMNLKEGLESAGHDVRILTLSGNARSFKKGRIYYIGSWSAEVIYPQARISLLRKNPFMEEILDWKPDVVHSQSEVTTFRFARQIAKKCHSALIHTYHTDYEEYTGYFCPNRMLGRKITEVIISRIMNHTTAVIVPTFKTKNIILRYHVKRPVMIVPSGVDLSRFGGKKSESRDRVRDELGIPPAEVMLLYVGRLAKEKNISELILLLKGTDPDQRLLIVGGGPYQKQLEKEAEDANVSGRIIFTGMVPRERIADYYAAGDIFVSASQSETQGLTCLEAMASGLPLLCRKDDCLRELVQNGVNGFTWSSREEFYRHLRRLKSDHQLREKTGNEAKASIQERYSIPHFARSCLAVYKKALQMNE